MDEELKSLWDEVAEYVKLIEVGEEGEHLWENYQRVTGILMRLQYIRNELVKAEIFGSPSPEAKKFRTLILDDTIARFDKLASFESRKITAKGLEIQLER